METLLTYLIHLPPEITQSIGYVLLFLATICEGIPPLGLLIPGQNLVIAGGFFTKLNILSLPIALTFIVIGAWIGDLFAYAIGKKYGVSFLHKYGKYIKITDTVLESVGKILHQNLAWGTILSKFYGRTRGIFPFMAGSLNTSFPKILLFT
jgi:membrane protein DedA with SNARE-associated domain